MPRPIETILSLPRVRLFNRVPILETEQLVHRFIDRIDYRQRLVREATEVSNGSAQQFSSDDSALSSLLEQLDSTSYIVTKRSRNVLEHMLKGICGDGSIFKGFEQEIKPLIEISQLLRQVSQLADSLADRTKEESMDVARALMIQLPTLGNEESKP
jgi:hypothetical protein